LLEQLYRRQRVPDLILEAVNDVALNEGNDRHRFVRDTLCHAGMQPVAMEGFAVWVAKLKPLLQ